MSNVKANYCMSSDSYLEVLCDAHCVDGNLEFLRTFFKMYSVADGQVDQCSRIQRNIRLQAEFETDVEAPFNIAIKQRPRCT